MDSSSIDALIDQERRRYRSALLKLALARVAIVLFFVAFILRMLHLLNNPEVSWRISNTVVLIGYVYLLFEIGELLLKTRQQKS